MLICVYRVVLISGRFSYIVVISGHAIDIVAYFVGFEVSSRWPTDMCLSRGGFLHGGVPPTGRAHLGLSRGVFGNIGDVGRVEGST